MCAKFSNIPLLPSPAFLEDLHLPLSVGTLGAFLYSGLYVLMEPVVGGIMLPFIVGGTAYSRYLIEQHGSIVNWWAGGINVASWILQFIGHGKFEGRAPALLDNLVQALFLAPFFVVFELMFSAGYRPELKARLDKNVKIELNRLEAEQKAKGKANGHAKGKKKA